MASCYVTSKRQLRGGFIHRIAVEIAGLRVSVSRDEAIELRHELALALERIEDLQREEGESA